MLSVSGWYVIHLIRPRLAMIRIKCIRSMHPTDSEFSTSVNMPQSTPPGTIVHLFVFTGLLPLAIFTTAPPLKFALYSVWTHLDNTHIRTYIHNYKETYIVQFLSEWLKLGRQPFNFLCGIITPTPLRYCHPQGSLPDSTVIIFLRLYGPSNSDTFGIYSWSLHYHCHWHTHTPPFSNTHTQKQQCKKPESWWIRMFFFFQRRGNHAADMVVITTVTMTVSTYKQKKTWKIIHFKLSEGFLMARWNPWLGKTDWLTLMVGSSPVYWSLGSLENGGNVS